MKLLTDFLWSRPASLLAKKSRSSCEISRGVPCLVSSVEGMHAVSFNAFGAEFDLDRDEADESQERCVFDSVLEVFSSGVDLIG